jgi:hypothetical protein
MSPLIPGLLLISKVMDCRRDILRKVFDYQVAPEAICVFALLGFFSPSARLIQPPSCNLVLQLFLAVQVAMEQIWRKYGGHMEEEKEIIFEFCSEM